MIGSALLLSPSLLCFQIYLLPVILSEKLYIAVFILILSSIMFGYISLHSAILVPNNSFIVLVNNLLFQHYSCQIYNQNYASIIGSGIPVVNHFDLAVQITICSYTAH